MTLLEFFQQSRYLLLLLILFNNRLFVPNAQALSAHTHEKVHLDIAVDKNELLIMLRTPSESILDFEYKPKTKKELELVKKVANSWGLDVKELLNDGLSKNCQITRKSWEQHFEGEGHSEILAEARLRCPEKLKGKQVVIDLKRKYPKVEETHLQLIRENGSVVNKKFKRVIKVTL